jgi:hypothetical protein
MDKNGEKYKAFVSKMQDLENSRNQESAHIEADDILCQLLIELGYKEIVDAFENIGKWYA